MLRAVWLTAFAPVVPWVLRALPEKIPPEFCAQQREHVLIVVFQFLAPFPCSVSLLRFLAPFLAPCFFLSIFLDDFWGLTPGAAGTVAAAC